MEILASAYGVVLRANNARTIPIRARGRWVPSLQAAVVATEHGHWRRLPRKQKSSSRSALPAYL